MICIYFSGAPCSPIEAYFLKLEECQQDGTMAKESQLRYLLSSDLSFFLGVGVAVVIARASGQEFALSLLIRLYQNTQLTQESSFLS